MVTPDITVMNIIRYYAFSASAPSISTLALLFSTSTKPPDISYSSDVFLSFITFILPLPSDAMSGAWLSSSSKEPSVPDNCMPYTSPLYIFFSGVNISSCILAPSKLPQRGRVLNYYFMYSSRSPLSGRPGGAI